MNIRLVSKGNFEKANNFFEKCKSLSGKSKFDEYGRRGVEALKAATPVNTGLAASSWRYEIVRTKNSVKIEWHNDDIENGLSVAILIQYGHATKSGTYVPGYDYINPAMEPIFYEIVNEYGAEVVEG